MSNGRGNSPVWQVLARKDVLSGLMFIAIALFALWVSRDYPIGTALRMGTGYVPRLLCWTLFALGAVILIQGLRHMPPDEDDNAESGWRPLLFVTLSLIVFGLTIERLGLVVAILLLTCIGAVADRSLKPIETLIAGVALVVLSWAIFILGLGLTIPVWPEW